MTTTRLLLVILTVFTVPCAARTDTWKAPAPTSVDDMRLAAMWGAAQARNAHRLAEPPLDTRDFILADLSMKQNRRYIDYSGDISGRWIAAAAFLAPLYPKPFAAFPAVIAEIPTYQKPDGHFGVDQDLPHINHDRDTAILWGNGRLLIGLIEVYERTGDAKALATARRLGDYFIATDAVFDKPEIIRRKPGGYSLNFETYYLSCIEGLVALGRVTGENRYWDEAKRIANLAMTVTDFDALHSHGRLCAVRGIADLYEATGDSRWREAFERDWAQFVKRYRLPTGGVKEVLEPACNRDEGCAESDWLRLNLSLWRLTGQGRYLDEAERCLKGHFIANQFPNGGAGHRLFHQIDGRPVAFRPGGEEAWWCCSEHWTRAMVDVARHAVTGGPQGPCINLMIDCEGAVAGPGGKWKIAMRELPHGLHVTVTSPASTKATLRIHRPAWAERGARIEKPDSLSLTATGDAWLLDGVWAGVQTIVVHLPDEVRCEVTSGDVGALLQGYDLLVAHPSPANAWLLDALPGELPTVLWSASSPDDKGRIVVSASLKARTDPNQPDQWKPLELTPLRAAMRPNEAAWFLFRLRQK
jgi:DUF1680 family protein